MDGFEVEAFALAITGPARAGVGVLEGGQRGGGMGKMVFDLLVSLLLLLPLFACALCLILLNPFLNRGPLFFRQRRMGLDCEPFTALKFRSMVPARAVSRGPFDPLEEGRIGALGRLIRRLRIDELPQIINVLRGEMSLIGPRPDSYDHASVYLRTVPGYRDRHAVLPGISGLAQTEVGYVDSPDSIRRKVACDLDYVMRASLALDLRIALRTVWVVLTAAGR